MRRMAVSQVRPTFDKLKTRHKKGRMDWNLSRRGLWRPTRWQGPLGVGRSPSIPGLFSLPDQIGFEPHN